MEIGRVKTLLSPRMASKGLKRCRDLLLPSCSFDELARERAERQRGRRRRREREREESSSRSVQPAGFSSNRRRHDSAGPLGIDHGALPPAPTPSPSWPPLREKPTTRHSGFCFTGRLMQSHVSIAKCYSSWEAGVGWEMVDNIGSFC